MYILVVLVSLSSCCCIIVEGSATACEAGRMKWEFGGRERRGGEGRGRREGREREGREGRGEQVCPGLPWTKIDIYICDPIQENKA